MLEFEFDEILGELRALARIAAPFLLPQSQPVLLQLATTLDDIRGTNTTATRLWEISDEWPLVTVPSFGSYQLDDEGALNIFAKITGVWEIARIRPPGKKNTLAATFALCGNASTKVELFEHTTEVGNQRRLAMWRSEIGATDSPGCHFHTQILGDATEAPFPSSVDIPRLPGILTTPGTVLEFVLGELFQREWPQHTADHSADFMRWGNAQRRRLSALLAWQREAVDRSEDSPWPTLKAAKPPSNLFCAVT